MSGIPPNGAQRASRQAAGGVALGLPRRNRHRSIIVVGQITLVSALILSQMFVDPGLGSAEAATRPVLVSAATLKTKPMSGAAWRGLKAVADQPVGTLTLSDMDENSDITVLAKGLVYARTGTASYRTAVIAALKAAKGTENGGETLALGRNLSGLVIAADLISLKTADPAFDAVFRTWLRSLLTKVLGGRSLIDTHEKRPNNWGTHAGASRVAIAAYLGDTTQLARAAKVFRGYLGSRATYAGFKYGDDLTWQCDPAKPVGINPAGCTKNGVSIDGVIPDDMRRGGSFRWPPSVTEYPWEGLQGALLQAELLRVAGYDTWNWENRALLRAVRFLYNRAKWPANDDDEWQTWLLDARYGTNYKLPPPVRFGKSFGFTDWIYGPAASGGTDPTPAPTPAPTATPPPTPIPTPVSGTATVGTTAPSSRIPGGLSFAAGTVPLYTSWKLTGDATTLKQYQLQQSTNGGSWTNVALKSATSTSAIVAVVPGRDYRYRSRAFDKLGRASAWLTGPTVTTSVAQESAAGYTGTWVTAGHPDYLGGKARASETRGSQVTFKFDGPSVGLVGPMGPTRGKADVYLDGKLLITIDTYASSFRARRVLQTIFTSDGSHTVTVRVLATSGRPWFAIDAFFVMQRS
jgi:hypothetical protein